MKTKHGVNYAISF